MRLVSMDLDIEYLIYFLEDELRELSDIRISPVAPSGTRKAMDLPQDYDPSVGHVHTDRGVRVRAGTRDFFFPASWVRNQQLELVRELAQKIKDYRS
jgi:hypothetical protein